MKRTRNLWILFLLVFILANGLYASALQGQSEGIESQEESSDAHEHDQETFPDGYSVTSQVDTRVAQPGGDLPGDPAIQCIKIADGLVDPINVVSPHDGSDRLFVVERAGRIKIVSDGELLPGSFLDISEQVMTAFLEQGLYDIAFHPDYAQNGKFYLHFAELMRNGDSLIVEYQVMDDNPNKADLDSARVVLQIDQPYANHNGGELAFGPDGYLYIGSGDGGWEGDPLEAGELLAEDPRAGGPVQLRAGDGGQRRQLCRREVEFAVEHAPVDQQRRERLGQWVGRRLGGRPRRVVRAARGSPLGWCRLGPPEPSRGSVPGTV